MLNDLGEIIEEIVDIDSSDIVGDDLSVDENYSHIIQLDLDSDQLKLINEKNEIIIQKLTEIHESLEYVSQNYYNQQIYSRKFTEYFFGFSVLVLLLIVARLLYKLFNNIFFGGI